MFDIGDIISVQNQAFETTNVGMVMRHGRSDQIMIRWIKTSIDHYGDEWWHQPELMKRIKNGWKMKHHPRKGNKNDAANER